VAIHERMARRAGPSADQVRGLDTHARDTSEPVVGQYDRFRVVVADTH